MRAPDFANAMDVMFYGVLHPVLAALPVMKRRGSGRILVISSIGGKLPAPHLLPYVAAKHAAVGFAEGLRVEAIRHGITVTCAVPGLMRTGSPRNALFTGDQAAEHRWFTLGDSLPLVSMDAERAARQLVGAALKGKPEVAPTPLAKIGMRVHGLAPSTTMRLVSVVNRLLPGDETPRPDAPGARRREARALVRLADDADPPSRAPLPPARRHDPARPRPVDPPLTPYSNARLRCQRRTRAHRARVLRSCTRVLRMCPLAFEDHPPRSGDGRAFLLSTGDRGRPAPLPRGPTPPPSGRPPRAAARRTAAGGDAAEPERRRRGRPKGSTSTARTTRVVELTLTVAGGADGEWQAELKQGATWISRGLPVSAASVLRAAQELHAELAEPIEAAIGAAREAARRPRRRAGGGAGAGP